MLVVASYMSHRVLVQPSLDALYRGATEDFCSVRVCVSKSSVLLNAFFACFFWMPCTGDLCIYFAGFFRPSLKWFWKNRGMAPCFFAGCWWKSRSLKNIARCGHMCQSKLGCFALSRQPGLVVCEVPKLAVWNYLSLAFGSPRAGALRRCCLDAAWVRARTWSDQATQWHACKSVSANRHNKRHKTRQQTMTTSSYCELVINYFL